MKKLTLVTVKKIFKNEKVLEAIKNREQQIQWKVKEQQRLVLGKSQQTAEPKT